MQLPIECQGLPSDCWSHVQLVNDHPISLGMICGQQIGSPSKCWLSRLKLPLQISNYPNSSWCLVGTNPIYWPKNLSLQESNQLWSYNMSSKPYALNHGTTGWDLELDGKHIVIIEVWLAKIWLHDGFLAENLIQL